MMTRLRLKLHQQYANGFLEGGAVARLSLVADPDGRVVRSGWRMEAPLDVAGGAGDSARFTTFDLPGGGYYALEVARPRGSLITEEYEVREGEDREETLLIESSPHEYLGWQQYAGVLNQPMGEERYATRAFESIGATPRLFAAAMPPSFDAWNSFSPRAARDKRRWLKDNLLDWYPLTDPRYVTWFRSRPSPGASQEEYPRWVTLETGKILHLASVPWFWWGDDVNHGEQIQLLYDRLAANPSDPRSLGRLRVTVQDSRWFGLLEFIASGKLHQSRSLADSVLREEDPERALSGKVAKPLTAVAGGIICVSRASSPVMQPWDPWLKNLCDWFPDIPDGAVLRGARLLQQATNRAELESACGLLWEAVRRGIPYFTATLRILSLSLAQVIEDVPAMEEARRLVDGVATRVDPEQPFTVIRL